MVSHVVRSAVLLAAVSIIAGCGPAGMPAPGTAAASSPPVSIATPGPSATEAAADATPGVRPTALPSAEVPATAPPATEAPATEAPASAPPAAGVAALKSDAQRARATAADARAGARAVNAFGVDMYRRLRSPGENLVLSPTSIMLALSLVRPGARGETAAEIDEVMHEAATKAHAAWMNGLERALRKRNATYPDDEGRDRKVTLRVANAAFLQAGYPFEQAYLDALARRFGAGIRLTDFRADPAASRKTINAWIEKATKGRIPRLLGPRDVRTTTRFALVNAIYLKAPWARTFNPDETTNAPFRLANGTRIRVPTMVGPKEMSWIRYATGSGWRAAELPYLGGELAMTVILPRDIGAFERSMTPKRVETIVGTVAKAPIFRSDPEYPDSETAWKVMLPKFSIESRADLGKALKAAGMPLALDPDAADLMGIADPARTGEPGLFIAKAIHQANIDVDEKGTTAAASTAFLGETGGGPRTRYFKVNRPFVFVLRDVPTGAILFMGRVMDPTS